MQPALDTVQFNVKFGFLDDFGANQLTIEASINQAVVAPFPDFAIDVLELLNSASLPGEYFIWTCTCGIPECAGVESGVQVSFTPTGVNWNCLDSPFEEPTIFHFDRVAYVAAVIKVWAEFRQYYQSYTATGIQVEFCPSLRENEILARMSNH
jgi:hypothetical protein